MKLTIEHSASIDAWEIKHENVLLHDVAAIAEWRRQVLEQLAKLQGEPAYVLVDVSNVELSPAFAEHYGQVVREITSLLSLTVLRYGKTDGWTEMAVELQGAMNNYSSVIFADRKAAVAALSMLRAHADKT